MKASQFSDAQKAFILKQGQDGVPVAEICRKAGISQATYFFWKTKYDGLLPPEMRRLQLLEDENAKLKKIVADLTGTVRIFVFGPGMMGRKETSHGPTQGAYDTGCGFGSAAGRGGCEARL